MQIAWLPCEALSLSICDAFSPTFHHFTLIFVVVSFFLVEHITFIPESRSLCCTSSVLFSPFPFTPSRFPVFLSFLFMKACSKQTNKNKIKQKKWETHSRSDLLLITNRKGCSFSQISFLFFLVSFYW